MGRDGARGDVNTGDQGPRKGASPRGSWSQQGGSWGSWDPVLVTGDTRHVTVTLWASTWARRPLGKMHWGEYGREGVLRPPVCPHLPPLDAQAGPTLGGLIGSALRAVQAEEPGGKLRACRNSGGGRGGEATGQGLALQAGIAGPWPGLGTAALPPQPPRSWGLQAGMCLPLAQPDFLLLSKGA